MSHPFDLMCKRHPERQIDERLGRADRLCAECVLDAQNAGARQADASWHQRGAARYQNEQAPDGRYIHDEMRGALSRQPGERE